VHGTISPLDVDQIPYAQQTAITPRDFKNCPLLLSCSSASLTTMMMAPFSAGAPSGWLSWPLGRRYLLS
jgi:hypothetical protein